MLDDIQKLVLDRYIQKEVILYVSSNKMCVARTVPWFLNEFSRN